MSPEAPVLTCAALHRHERKLWRLPGLPDQALQRIFELSSQETQQALAQTCRHFWQLWHSFPDSASSDDATARTRSQLWRIEAPKRLWLWGASQRRHFNGHARGSYSFSTARFHSEHYGLVVLPVLQLQLQLSARSFRSLCSLAHSHLGPARFSTFAEGLRKVVDLHLHEDWDFSGGTVINQPPSPFRDGATQAAVVVRLRVRHNCSSVSDEERDVLQALLWEFPSLMFGSLIGAEPMFPDHWQLRGPHDTEECVWSIGDEAGLRAPRLAE